MSNFQAITRARAISRQISVLYSTILKISHKFLKFYPYKICLVQLSTALIGDENTRIAFSLKFLARMQVYNAWPLQILWSDEAHFHLNSEINIHNCRIWSEANPDACLQIPLHSQNVTVWYDFIAYFTIGPYFFARNSFKWATDLFSQFCLICLGILIFQDCSKTDVPIPPFLCKRVRHHTLDFGCKISCDNVFQMKE